MIIVLTKVARLTSQLLRAAQDSKLLRTSNEFDAVLKNVWSLSKNTLDIN